MSFQGGIQKYSVQRNLGKGNYGTIYEVLGSKDQKRYCLKKIQQHNYRLHEEKLIKERMNNMELNGMIIIYETFQLNGDQFQVLELCDGGDLSQQLGIKKQFSNNEITKIIQDIGNQLELLHRFNYIFMDLKPSNIVQQTNNSDNQSYQYKLIDFGSVIKLQAESDPQHQLKTPTILPTAGYQAPETLNTDDYSLLGTSFDIWSFGVLIYELISGQKLFQQTNDYETQKKIESYVRDQTQINQKIECLKVQKQLKQFIQSMISPLSTIRPNISQINKFFLYNLPHLLEIQLTPIELDKNQLQEKCQNLEEQLERLQKSYQQLQIQYNSLSLHYDQHKQSYDSEKVKDLVEQLQNLKQQEKENANIVAQLKKDFSNQIQSYQQQLMYFKENCHELEFQNKKLELICENQLKDHRIITDLNERDKQIIKDYQQQLKLIYQQDQYEKNIQTNNQQIQQLSQSNSMINSKYYEANQSKMSIKTNLSRIQNKKTIERQNSKVQLPQIKKNFQ